MSIVRYKCQRSHSFATMTCRVVAHLVLDVLMEVREKRFQNTSNRWDSVWIITDGSITVNVWYQQWKYEETESKKIDDDAKRFALIPKYNHFVPPCPCRDDEQKNRSNKWTFCMRTTHSWFKSITSLFSMSGGNISSWLDDKIFSNGRRNGSCTNSWCREWLTSNSYSFNCSKRTALAYLKSNSWIGKTSQRHESLCTTFQLSYSIRTVCLANFRLTNILSMEPEVVAPSIA